MRKRAGDTLIEVMLAVGIFSMIAIAIVAIMNGGSSGAQTSLESTLAREEVDTQAEALRFIQSAYIADLEADQTESKYVTLWQDIAKRAVTSTDTKINLNDISTAPSNCKKFYDDNSDSYKALREKAFIINPSKIYDLSNESTEVNQILYPYNSRFTPAKTYPRLIYSANQLNNKDNLADNTYGNLYRAEGIYVVAVKDRGSTAIINIDDEGDGTTQGEAVFFDFYIRTCWYGVGDDTPSSISTVVRLYDPDALAKLAADNIRGLVQVSYKYENSKLKPGQKELEDQSGYKAQTYNGENRLERTGYTFIGWCSGTVIPHNDGDDECRDGNVYQSDTTIKNPNEGILTLDLIAMWSRNRYTINYDPDGGSWSDLTSNVRSEVCYETDENGNPNTCHIYSADEPAQSGYRFIGWCNGSTINEACSGTRYEEKGAVINPFANGEPKGTINLKAIWKTFDEEITILAKWSTSDDYDYDSHMRLQRPDSDKYESANYGTRDLYVTYNGEKYSLITGNGDGRGKINKIYNEKFVIHTLGGKNYYYSIRNWSSPGNIGNGITVTVSGEYIATKEYFSKNRPSGPCEYWNVFAYINGRIVERNTCTSTIDYGY